MTSVSKPIPGEIVRESNPGLGVGCVDVGTFGPVLRHMVEHDASEDDDGADEVCFGRNRRKAPW